MLWLDSKKLLTLWKINSFDISNSTIRIKISENSSLLSITHVDDFSKHFPGIDLSPFRLNISRLNIFKFIIVASYYRL